MKHQLLAGCLALLLGLGTTQTHAAALTKGVFTEIVNDVKVVALPSRETTPAKLKVVFSTPDLVRTGPESRAELTADDHTITRVGANTVFSFEPKGRDVRLEQGSLLFHSPSGKGGGTIRSGGASAAVVGTTLIVSTTPVQTANGNNGFKVIVLEGKGRVTLGNGRYVTLKAGQLVFVLPGQRGFGPVLDINLSKLIAGSNLIIGFNNPLPSLTLIYAAIREQNRELVEGRAEDTGMSADQFAGQDVIPPNGIGGLDSTTFQLGATHAAPGNVPPGQPTKVIPVIIRVGP